LLATVAGTLALLGFDIAAACGYSHHSGMALEVFTGTDRFARLVGAADRARASSMLLDALRGTLSVDDALTERSRRYRPSAAGPSTREVRVLVDEEASAFATV